ncbi:MAG: NlpC/P60 family protein, partial [Bifidobacterium sp.]|uniref:NlpC/P60 family protein n=1 Tax=Bifidobacterium sp. TaxID=41200 RepID=UPI003F07D9B1
TVKGGASQTFQHGVVFWSPTTGAHPVRDNILREYTALKYEQGLLGFPVNDGMKLRGGTSQAFQNGQIHWSPSTGARFTRGAIQQYWSAHGWENGWLGWPTGDELTVKGGASQTFQHGVVFWSNTTGAHPVVGTTLSKYAAARYEQGQYGFPVEDQTGPSQRFQHGSIAGCGKIGYQNPGGFFQMSSCNVSVPGGAFGYASPSRISINANRDQVVNAFISRAYDYLGTRYVWDYAMQPGNGVDCAGLVMQSLYATGMDLHDYNPTAHWYDPWHSHDANNMSNDSRFLHIPVSQRQRGDLIFYPGHVAIYLGNDQVIEAMPPRVRIANMYAGNRHPTGAARPII